MQASGLHEVSPVREKGSHVLSYVVEPRSCSGFLWGAHAHDTGFQTSSSPKHLLFKQPRTHPKEMFHHHRAELSTCKPRIKSRGRRILSIRMSLPLLAAYLGGKKGVGEGNKTSDTAMRTTAE